MRKRAILGIGCVIALELGLRFIAGLGDPPLVTRDSDVEYRLVPSASYSRFGNRVDINSHGMRGPDHRADADARERRVLVIGDSVIYGNHYLDQAEIIPMQLTQRLTALPDQQGCIPLAMAVAASSWGPMNQAAFLADVGTLDAQAALLVVSAHDLYDTPTFQSDVIPYRERAPLGAIHDAVQVAISGLAKRFATPASRDAVVIRQAMSLAAMDQMHQVFQAAGSEFVLVYHPTVPEIERGVSREHAVFENWAQQRGIGFETLMSDALNASTYRDTIHPNATGAAEIARLLADLSQGMIPACGA